MILSEPIPWHDVPVGAVVLLDGVPRTVLLNEPMYPSFPGDSRVVLVEGRIMPPTNSGLATVQLVMLDESDAVAALAAAGLNHEIIDTEEP